MGSLGIEYSVSVGKIVLTSVFKPKDKAEGASSFLSSFKRSGDVICNFGLAVDSKLAKDRKFEPPNPDTSTFTCEIMDGEILFRYVLGYAELTEDLVQPVSEDVAGLLQSADSLVSALLSGDIDSAEDIVQSIIEDCDPPSEDPIIN